MRAEVASPETRQCRKCLLVKALVEFQKDKRSSFGRLRVCRACTRKAQKNWRGKNPERFREIQRKYYYKYHHKRLHHSRVSRLKIFGITVEQYEEMLRSQGGVCLICGKQETHHHQNGKVKKLAVDHDHKTGRVRGLLCARCNRAMGMIGEDPRILQRMIEYLR